MPGGGPFFFRGNRVGVLLLHGLTGTPYEVRELGERLNGAGYTALGLRLPGHATRYQDLDTVSLDDWMTAIEVSWEMLAQRCDQIFLMGISMGASLSLLTASRHPNASGVVGLATIWGLPNWQMAITRRFLPWRPYQRKRRGSSIADPVAKAKHPTYTHISLSAVLEFDKALRQMQAILPTLTVPVLLLHSRRDPVAPPSDADKVMAALGSPDKRLHWVERGAHIITEDYDKEEVFAEVLAWVGQRVV